MPLEVTTTRMTLPPQTLLRNLIPLRTSGESLTKNWVVQGMFAFHHHQGCVIRSFGTINMAKYQGCVVRRIRIIRRIVFNAYFTILNKSGCIIRLQKLPNFGLFRRFPPHKRPFSELPMLLHNILMIYWGKLETFWVILG